MAKKPLLLTAVKYGGYLLPGVSARIARHLFRTPHIAATKAWELAVEDSAERGYLTSGISFLRWQPRTQQTAMRVLAIHGWEGRSTQWGPLARVLESRGIEVIALDGPGHGRSPGKFADPILFADAIMAADRELGPFDAILGHSMGAGSSAIAIHRGLRVKKMVYIAGPAAFREVVERFATFFGLPHRARRAFIHQIERVNGKFADNDVLSVLAREAIVGLIIHDRGDDDVPYRDAERLHQAWTASRLLTTEGLGHKRVLRDPDVMEQVAEFLTAAN